MQGIKVTFAAAGAVLAMMDAQAAGTIAAFGKNPEPCVAVPRTAAPVVDGTLGVDEWKDAVRMVGFCYYRRRDAFPADASFMMKQAFLRYGALS